MRQELNLPIVCTLLHIYFPPENRNYHAFCHFSGIPYDSLSYSLVPTRYKIFLLAKPSMPLSGCYLGKMHYFTSFLCMIISIPALSTGLVIPMHMIPSSSYLFLFSLFKSPTKYSFTFLHESFLSLNTHPSDLLFILRAVNYLLP